MSYFIARPSPSLSRYVRQFWMIDNCVQPGDDYTYRIVPGAMMELNFYFGAKPLAPYPGKELSENSLVSGQLKGAYNLHISNNLKLFSITFQPLGASLFFSIPMNEFCDRNVPLRFVEAEFCDRMENELFEADSFDQKVAVAEKLLLKQLYKNETEHELKRIARSIELVNQNHHEAVLRELAGKACLSTKQFERVFNKVVGISPGRYLRIVRFQYAIYLKQMNRQISLTALAHDAGYFDQPHMIHEFRKLSGMTPSQFFEGCEPYSDYFTCR